MHQYTPIEFVGGNLGQRHKHMNQCVKDAIERNVTFEDIKNAQEVYIVDRLFKIDVASKCRNVDYILETLKERNMLYVSRALKSTWLITDAEYAHVINPRYLEEELFPTMLTTGVTKMQHIIYLYLKDEKRCSDFYRYYKDKQNLIIAKHFLPKCSEDIIMNELNLYVEDVTPHYLKLLCEKCPRVLPKYFDVFVNDTKKFKKFNGNIDTYLDITKILLKSQPKLYFEMIEKYSSSDKSNKRVSPKATQYVMARHRNRYLSKPELYGGALLHLPTLARCLSEEEAQDLLLRLARARYLAPWFTLTYKSAEPLLDRIGKEGKQTFVERIFVHKNFGSVVTEAPYPLPGDIDEDSFSNSDDSDLSYDNDMGHSFSRAKFLKKNEKCRNMPTLLDKLFDKYRFTTFSKTFTELKKLLQSESSHKSRLMILNVLVSKTSKRADHIQMLLELVRTRHANEPITLRASFIRSLVRRAATYRLPDQPWQMFQKMVLQTVFQSEEQVPCDEGLHAILIHDILNDREVDPVIFSRYITVFNPFVEYGLSGKEKQKVYQRLYSMLLAKSKSWLLENNFDSSMEIVNKILELIKAHKIDLDLCSEVIDIVKTVSENDLEKSKGTLMRLYKMRKCRRTFTKENFLLNQNNASYINALRHDVSLLTDTDKFADLITKRELKMDVFLIKLKIYFEELASKFKTVVEDKLKSKPGDTINLKLCRALCILKGPAVFPLIKDLYAGGKEDNKLAQTLAANVHMAWSVDGVPEIVFKELGAVASRNSLSGLPAGAVRAHLPALLGGPASLERLGVALALRRLPAGDIMNVVTHVRQKSRTRTKRVLLKNLYKYIHFKGESLRLDLWEQMKKLMIEFCPYYDERLWKILSDSVGVPDVIKVEYCLTILTIKSYKEFKVNKCTNWRTNLYYLSKRVSELNEIDAIRVLKPLLEYKFEEDATRDGGSCFVHNTYIKILTRFLLTCVTETIQNERFRTVGLVFLNNIKNCWNECKHKLLVSRCLEDFLSNLKCNKVFLNENFVNCMPLFNSIVEQMHTFLDVKQHFKLYSLIHLTMLYYKTLQHIKKEQPSLLSEQVISAEAASAVGLVFGRYLAREHRQLVDDYFPTITYIYADDVCDYIGRYKLGSGKYWQNFLTAIIKSVAYSGEDNSMSLAILMAQKLGFLRDVKCSVLQDIVNLVDNSKDARTQAFWSVFRCHGPLAFY